MLEGRKQTSECPELRVERTEFAMRGTPFVGWNDRIRAPDAFFGLPTEADGAKLGREDPIMT